MAGDRAAGPAAAALAVSAGRERAVSRTPPPVRYVYVIGPAAGLQKVGLATDPRARLAALQTVCPFDLHLHVAVSVPFGEAHAIERRAHRALAKACVRNEWFAVSPAEAVAAVREAANPPEEAAPALPKEWQPRPVPDLTVLPLFGFRREVGPVAAACNATPRRALLDVCRAVIGRR